MSKTFTKVLIILIILGLSFFIQRTFFGEKKPSFETTRVSRGNVLQEILVAGQVKKGEEIHLGFESSGTIEKVYIKVGEGVETNDPLAKLNTSQLLIQLQEAQAALEVAQAQLDKLLAGPTKEEIEVAETQVTNAQISLTNAQQNLEDIKNSAQEDLENAYEDALNSLDDGYLKIYNAFNTVDLVQRSYFNANDQEGLKVRENKDIIERAMNLVGSYLEIVGDNSSNENIDTTLSETRGGLDNTSQALAIIRQTCEAAAYRNVVSTTDKSSIDTQRTYINTALTNLIDCQQTISSTKIDNESDINTAEATVLTAEGTLKEAEKKLAELIAKPLKEDIDFHQAKIKQAEAQVNLLKHQIQEATLTSPIEGQITKINKKEGEIVQSTDQVVFLIPQGPFQIEADIPEVDIGKVDLQDPCKIELDALPEIEFSGKVIEIDPAETIIQGVVYYRVKVSLETEEERIKPGMTANVTILAFSKEDVLVLPQRAVIEREGKKFVRIPTDNTYQEVEIETGLKGSGGEIEIISGLKEGEEIITFLKEK